MMREAAFRQISDAGEKLLALGINTTHSGNVSIRGENEIYITRTGSRLDRLSESDIIPVPLNEETQGIASVELPMHRAIYQGTSYKAILHAHPPHTIVFSLLEDSILPVDNEGFYFLGEIPVLKPKEVSGSVETGKLLAETFRDGPHVAIVRGHGSFAVGENLEEALHWTSTLERACQMGYILRTVSEFRYKEIIRSRKEEIRKKKQQTKNPSPADRVVDSPGRGTISQGSRPLIIPRPVPKSKPPK